MQVVLNIPPDIELGLSEFDLKMYIGVSFYEKDLMSSGLAAEIVGIERRIFLENMGKYGMSIFEKLTEDDIRRDAEVVKQYFR
jgi:predicted HTH domain antitoxin